MVFFPRNIWKLFLQGQDCSSYPLTTDESEGSHQPKPARQESLGTERPQSQGNFNKSGLKFGLKPRVFPSDGKSKLGVSTTFTSCI